MNYCTYCKGFNCFCEDEEDYDPKLSLFQQPTAFIPPFPRKPMYEPRDPLSPDYRGPTVQNPHFPQFPTAPITWMR